MRRRFGNLFLTGVLLLVASHCARAQTSFQVVVNGTVNITTTVPASSVTIQQMGGYSVSFTVTDPNLAAGSQNIPKGGTYTWQLTANSCVANATVGTITASGGATFQVTQYGSNCQAPGTAVSVQPNTCGAGQAVTSIDQNGTVHCGATGGVGNLLTTLGDSIYGGVGGAATRLPGPTTPNNVPQTWINVPSAGAAVAEAWSLAGVPVNPQTGASYAFQVTDRASYVTFSNAGAIAVTLPQAGSTGFGSNFVVVACDIGVGLVTITPTSSTISYTTGSSYTSNATSMPLSTGQCAWIYSDNNNYSAILRGGNKASLSITDIAPVSGDDGLILVIDPVTPIHLTRISCGVQGTTSAVVNLVKAATSLIADATCTAGDANTVVVTTFANGSSQCGATTSCAVPAHTPVTLHIGTVSGTPTALQVSVDYTVD